MSTARSSLTVTGIDVDVIYKDIKNLHIGVYPPQGRVRVSAPHRLDDDQVRLAVVQRLPWIRQKRERLRSAVRESSREMVTGESHYAWGVRHRLRVIERPGRADVEVDGRRLLMFVPPGTDRERRLEVLRRWRREELRQRIPGLLDTWQPVVGRSASRWSIRRMKTKWGSCNRESGHLRFNSELACKHPDLLEYVVVHELAHLLEGGHGERFTRLMDGFMSDWRARRDLLNDAPLAHEDWLDE